MYNNTQVVNSPLTYFNTKNKYNKTGEVIKTKKLLIQIQIREIHNDSVKPSSEGGFAGAR